MDDTEKIKLLCFPCAGASALFYSGWAKQMDEHIIVVPVELPGRGLRFKENLCEDLDQLIDSIFDFVKAEIKDSQYALFGFCVASIIVYELYKRIADNNLREPSHCFLCAYPAPNLPKEDKPIKDMSDEELIEETLRIGRIRKEDLNDKEYLERFFRVWKSDCTIMDNYRFSYPICKFNCDLTLLIGKDDTLFAPAEAVEKWGEFTNCNSNKYIIEGSHDFIKTNVPAIIDVINKEL